EHEPGDLAADLGDDRRVGVPAQVITDPALPNFRPVLAADLLVDGDDVADVHLVERADADLGRGLSHVSRVGGRTAYFVIPVTSRHSIASPGPAQSPPPAARARGRGSCCAPGGRTRNGRSRARG